MQLHKLKVNIYHAQFLPSFFSGFYFLFYFHNYLISSPACLYVSTFLYANHNDTRNVASIKISIIAKRDLPETTCSLET